MFGFGSRTKSFDGGEFIKEANLQIELMHSELELSRKKEKQLEEENTKLRYQLNEAVKQVKNKESQIKDLKAQLQSLLQAFAPFDKLYNSLKGIRASLGVKETVLVEENSEKERDENES